MINSSRNRFVPQFNSRLQQNQQLGSNLFKPQIKQALPINARDFNTFGFNEPMPQEPRIPGVNAPIDFTAETAKIYGNRPNRLAYQQAVEEGPEQINRGKWAKLGAMLAAGGTALGPGGATAGYNLGRSAYEAPQMRADENYERKVRDLGNLAQMEESDITGKISALEAQNRNYWAGREDTRAERGESRADRGETRADRLAESQIRNAALDNISMIQGEDGNTYAYDKGTKTKLLVAKTGLSTREQEASAARTLANQEEVKGYYQKLSDDRQAASSYRNTMAGVEGRTEAEKIKADAKIRSTVANIKAKAAQLGPDTVGGKLLEDMAVAVGKGELPVDAPTYLDFDENNVPTSNAGWTGDADTADLVRKFIASSIERSRSGGDTTGPALAPRNTGPSAGVPGSRYPRNADGTVPMIDPEGIPFDAPAEDVPNILKADPKVRVGYPAGLNTPAATPAAPPFPRSNIAAPEETPYVPYRPNAAPPRPINRGAAAANLGATAPPVTVPNVPVPVVPPVAQPNIPAPVNPIQLSNPVARPGVPSNILQPMPNYFQPRPRRNRGV